MQEKIIYFEKAGKENTPEVLRLVAKGDKAANKDIELLTSKEKV